MRQSSSKVLKLGRRVIAQRVENAKFEPFKVAVTIAVLIESFDHGSDGFYRTVRDLLPIYTIKTFNDLVLTVMEHPGDFSKFTHIV